MGNASLDGGDIIHTEGFPDGWLVQERDQYEALLCFQPEFTVSSWLGPTCYCRKPRLEKIEDWLPAARTIAAALDKQRGETA